MMVRIKVENSLQDQSNSEMHLENREISEASEPKESSDESFPMQPKSLATQKLAVILGGALTASLEQVARPGWKIAEDFFLLFKRLNIANRILLLRNLVPQHVRHSRTGKSETLGAPTISLEQCAKQLRIHHTVFNEFSEEKKTDYLCRLFSSLRFTHRLWVINILFSQIASEKNEMKPCWKETLGALTVSFEQAPRHGWKIAKDFFLLFTRLNIANRTLLFRNLVSQHVSHSRTGKSETLGAPTISLEQFAKQLRILHTVFNEFSEEKKIDSLYRLCSSLSFTHKLWIINIFIHLIVSEKIKVLPCWKEILAPIVETNVLPEKRMKRERSFVMDKVKVEKNIQDLDNSEIHLECREISEANLGRDNETQNGKNKTHKRPNTRSCVQRRINVTLQNDYGNGHHKESRAPANTKTKKKMPQIDLNEPTYCLCEDVSYGKMIGCDSESCNREWFHFTCIGLTTAPKGKWYCPACRGNRSNQMRPKAVRKSE